MIIDVCGGGAIGKDAEELAKARGVEVIVIIVLDVCGGGAMGKEMLRNWQRPGAGKGGGDWEGGMGTGRWGGGQW